MKVYISGPMTDMKDYNFPAFFKAEELLIDSRLNFFDGRNAEGIACEPNIINPAKLVPPCRCPTWVDYMRRDIVEMMNGVTDIVLLEGWEKSKGAVLEHYIARAMGFRIWFLDIEKITIKLVPLEQ